MRIALAAAAALEGDVKEVRELLGRKSISWALEEHPGPFGCDSDANERVILAVAGPDPAVLGADVARGEDVAQEERVVVGQLGRNLLAQVIGERHPDALGLAAAPHVAEAPAEDGAARGRALRGQPPATPLALAARHRERHDHAVPHPDRAHGAAGLLDHAHELVPHDGARLHEGAAAAAVVLVQVGAAHRAGGDPHEDVGRVDQLGIGHVGGAHVADAVERDGLHRAASSVS